MGTMMNLPPPPPRYHPTQNTGAPGLIPPPPPLPGANMAQGAPWHGTFGSMYSGRQGFVPPPPTGPHQPYNPQLHAQMAAQTVPQMTATYVPTGDTIGDIPGIPGFDREDLSASTLPSQTSWLGSPPQSGTETTTTTPMDDYATRQRQGNGQGRADANSNSGSSIPPKVAAQWPLDTVLIWLASNQFSNDWQETFRALNIHGAQFLEIGLTHRGRGKLSVMHEHVYPRLQQACVDSGNTWDKAKEREQRDEAKRLRQLIRSAVLDKPVEPSKLSIPHARRESGSGGQAPSSLPSAGTDAGGSPNVSCFHLCSLISSLTFDRHHSMRQARTPAPEDIHRHERQTSRLEATRCRRTRTTEHC